MLRLLNIGYLMPPVSVLSAGICYSKPADKNRGQVNGTTRIAKEEKKFHEIATFLSSDALSSEWVLKGSDGFGVLTAVAPPWFWDLKKCKKTCLGFLLRGLKKIPDNNHSYLVNLLGCCFFRVVSSYKQSRSSLAFEHISLQFSIMSRASLRSPDWKAAFAAK